MGAGVSSSIDFIGTASQVGRLLVLSHLVKLLAFIRIGILGVSRSQALALDLNKNICELRINPSVTLQGTEIISLPFDLYVEDVNTWKWLRDKYIGWVHNRPHNIKCKYLSGSTASLRRIRAWLTSSTSRPLAFNDWCYIRNT